MRGEWVQLCAETSRFTFSQVSERVFKDVRGRHAALMPFETPRQVVLYQHARDHTPAERNAIWHALITEYQEGRGRGGSVAGALLFVGMAPALARVFYRVTNLFNEDDDAAAEVSVAFYERLRKWKLEKTDYIAVKLQADTKDAVVARRKRLFSDRKRVDVATVYADAIVATPDEHGPGLDDDPDSIDGRIGDDGGETGKSGDSDPFEPVLQGSASDLWRALPSSGVPDSHELNDEEILELQRTLTRSFGIRDDEALLLVLKYVCKLCWNDIGQRLLLNPETARKRLRTLRKALSALDEARLEVPDFEIGTRSIGVRGKDAPKQTRRTR
jgi:hypothetical protein